MLLSVGSFYTHITSLISLHLVLFVYQYERTWRLLYYEVKNDFILDLLSDLTQLKCFDTAVGFQISA